MISEFYQFDSWGFYDDYSYKELSAVPFAMGILVLGWYYIWYAPRHRKHQESFAKQPKVSNPGS
jgi:hypothetical protein